MKEQEKEIDELKESIIHKADIISPRPRHFRSTAKWNHEDDFLAKYLSKEPPKDRNMGKDVDIHELRLDVEEETVS